MRMHRLFFLSSSKVSMLFCSFDINHQPTVLNSSGGGGSGAVVVKVKDTTSGWKKKKKKKVIIREISLLENKRRAWRR